MQNYFIRSCLENLMGKLWTEGERLPRHPAFIRHPSPRAKVCALYGIRHLWSQSNGEKTLAVIYFCQQYNYSFIRKSIATLTWFLTTTPPPKTVMYTENGTNIKRPVQKRVSCRLSQTWQNFCWLRMSFFASFVTIVSNFVSHPPL
jgi:hypothetical protein